MRMDTETEGLLPPSRGHNLPDLHELLSEDAVAAIIEAATDPLRERANVLAASCKKFIETYHAVIGTDEEDGVAAGILAVCQRFTAKKSGRVDAAREALKAPVLKAGKAIDAAFPLIAKIVEDAVLPIVRASTAYKVDKDRKAREDARIEAERKAAAAAAAERAADAGAGTFDDAAAAYAAAEKAQRAADAKPAERTRTHGDDIGTSSLRYKRVVTITEPHEVPRAYCVPDPSALSKAAGKAGSPIPSIPGVTIEDVPDLTVRR